MRLTLLRDRISPRRRSFRTEPRWTSWGITRPHARCSTWVGAIPNISKGFVVSGLRAALPQRTWGSGWMNSWRCLGNTQLWKSTRLHQKHCGLQIKGDDFISLLYWDSPLECYSLLWGPQHRKDMDLLEWLQRRAMKMITELEQPFYEERLRKFLEKPYCHSAMLKERFWESGKTDFL